MPEGLQYIDLEQEREKSAKLDEQRKKLLAYLEREAQGRHGVKVTSPAA